MSKLIASRVSVVAVAALFAAATWFNASVEAQTAPTSLVLSQPEQPLSNMAANHSAPRP